VNNTSLKNIIRPVIRQSGSNNTTTNNIGGKVSGYTTVNNEKRPLSDIDKNAGKPLKRNRYFCYINISVSQECKVDILEENSALKLENDRVFILVNERLLCYVKEKDKLNFYLERNVEEKDKENFTLRGEYCHFVLEKEDEIKKLKDVIERYFQFISAKQRNYQMLVKRMLDSNRIASTLVERKKTSPKV
jgi:hypothetical protein